MTDTKNEVLEPIIELVETIPLSYMIAALVAGAVIGAAILLLLDDAARRKSAPEPDEANG